MRGGWGLGLLGVVGLAACASAPAEDPAARALRIHREAIVLDTHADTTPHFQDPNWDFAARHAKSDSDIDLPRAREGGLDVQFWSIYVGKVEGDGRAIREALERIDAVWQLARRYPNDVVVATDVAGHPPRRRGGEARLAHGRRRRPHDRGQARGAARLLPAGRALHDADPLAST